MRKDGLRKVAVHWVLVAAWQPNIVGATEICFDGSWTEARCCGPTADPECWGARDSEDVEMQQACCLENEVATDPPPPAWLLPELEARLSCRTSPLWSRFRRHLSGKLHDGVLVPSGRTLRGSFNARALKMLGVHADHAVFKLGTVRTRFRDNRTGEQAHFDGNLQDCPLGYATALVVSVLLADLCASVVKGVGQDELQCLTAEERRKHLAMAEAVQAETMSMLGAVPAPFALGLLASTAWPFHRLHMLHYFEAEAFFVGRPWIFGLQPRYLAQRGGQDPESLLPSARPGAAGVSVLLHVYGADWGGVEVASTLASVCGAALTELHILVEVDRASVLRATLARLPASAHVVTASRGDSGALHDWARQSEVLITSSPSIAVRLMREAAKPVVLYLWDLPMLRHASGESAWRSLGGCDALGAGAAARHHMNSEAPPGPRCLVIAASPLVAEASLPHLGHLPPILRPLCTYTRAGPGPVPAQALVVRHDASVWVSCLRAAAAPGFPVEIVDLPLSAAASPPAATAAVIFPWSLWMPAFVELYAAGMPLAVPTAEYLAELPCARNAADVILAGLQAARPPPIAEAAWQDPGFARRTRCGSCIPAIAAAIGSPKAAQARMVVEFSELVRWPGLAKYASVADLLARLHALATGGGERAELVRQMASFNTEARAAAGRLWSAALQGLAHGFAEAASAEPAAHAAATPMAGASASGPSRTSADFGAPVLPQPSAPGSCGLPPATPSAAETPLKRRHRQMMRLFHDLEAPLRRLGLRQSLGFGTLLGAVRHRGLVPHDGDLDVYIGPIGGRPMPPPDRLCRAIRRLVRQLPRGRHRAAVLCAGTRGASAARRKYQEAMATGAVPLCQYALDVMADPWYDVEWVGWYEEDPILARLVARAPHGGGHCLAHFLDFYASGRVFREFGPLCRCRWEGLSMLCISGWDSYLRKHYGDDYMTPRIGPPHDEVPFGPTGNTACWDGVFTAAACCNEAGWTVQEQVDFHMVLQADWRQRCEGRRDLYGGGRPGSWQGGLYQELIFFFAYLRAGSSSTVLRHASELAAAFNSSTPLSAKLSAALLLDAQGRMVDTPEAVRILDVGSGPVSLIGYTWSGVDVEIVAVDPLACEYGEMRRDLGIEVPSMAAPRALEAESLSAAFGPAAFDLVHCTNALDHSHDPLRALAEMLQVVRPGRPVFLQHSRNEGASNDYAGLHQWNFDVREGRFVIWRPYSEEMNWTRTEVDVAQHLAASGNLRVDIEARRVDAPYAHLAEGGIGALDWVEVMLWRTSEA